MPDQIHDPIRDLENFGTGGVHVTPLEPAQVRRLGDKRRARRRTTIMVAAAAVVAAAVIPVSLLARDGDGANDPGPAVPSPTPTHAEAPRTITYPGIGVEVKTAADVDKLTGTSADFKAFIASEAAAMNADGAQCPDAAHEASVEKYSTAGYAIGGLNDCGGVEVLWVKLHGTWGRGQLTQDAWDCDALAFLGVPRSFATDCTTESGVFGMKGTGQPEPGMNRAAASAAGLTIEDGKAVAPPCVGTRYTAPVLPRGGDTVSTSSEGLFSPTDGLVSVEMTADTKTEEKVGLGTPRSAVVAAYPNGQDNGGLWIVPRPGGTSYTITFGPDNRVVGFSWSLDQADCAGYLK